jgi:putative transposase
VSWSATRRSGPGARSSGRPTPTSCAGGAPAPATNGISMKSSSKINGTIHYLWRAVDQHGNVLDILVQSRRNALAARKFFRKLLKGLWYVPRVLVTDKLASYGPAYRVVMPSVQHRQSKYLNNRAENSHQPTRQRERAMKRFTSPGHAQRFLSAFSGISPHFRPRRHLLSAADYRQVMADRFTVWNEITGVATTAA